MRRAKVTVCHDHGKVTLIYKGKSLPYKIFDNRNQTTPIASSKQINQVVENTQKSRPKEQSNTLHKPGKYHPWRNRGSAKNKDQGKTAL